MEKAISSAIEPTYTPPLLRERPIPDVPEDVDSVMDHLNDPNWDVRASFDSTKLENKKPWANTDEETSSRYSTSRAESHISTTDDFDDDSPYPEVRAAVSNTDDPNLPVNTFRMWFLGIFWSLLLAIFNVALSLRYPSTTITGLIVQLLTLPMGKAMEKFLPTRKFFIFGYECSLNPGPFNMKEHVAITVMANIAYPGGYATDIPITQRYFYKQNPGVAYQILLVLGIQAYGFCLAGGIRKWVVYPSSMLWPGAIVNAALFNTLHKTFSKSDRGHMSREKFFYIVAAAAFVWYFIPGFLFTALSVFTWVCWIAPNNVTINTLFGASGLGMNALTFDWSMISVLSSPMVTPWWAELNVIIGFFIVFWIIAPAIYFSNTFYSAFLPIATSQPFDNTGMPYDVTLVMTNNTFDAEKYAAYSPMFVSTAMALEYGLAFAALPAVVIHTCLWYRKDIARRFRATARDERDVHYRLMRVYPEVPAWWYAAIGVVSLVILIVAVELFDTKLPIWAVLLAMFISACTTLPLTIIYAVANTSVGLTVVYELICGYIFPGRPVANVIFKAVGYTGSMSAGAFAGDLKLGQYMKVPPRTMFAVQTVAVVITCVFNVLTQEWMSSNLDGFCTPDQAQGFVCPGTNIFGTSSILWGAVGANRMFGPDGVYRPLLWFWLVGVFLPIPPYLLAKRYPNAFWRYINIPVILSGIAAVPPASGLNFVSWAIVGFVFNYFLRRFHFRWWMRYNYITAAALDAGTTIGIIILFLCIQLPTDGKAAVNWVGNQIWIDTADAMGIPLKTPDPTFGPASWS